MRVLSKISPFGIRCLLGAVGIGAGVAIIYPADRERFEFQKILGPIDAIYKITAGGMKDCSFSSFQGHTQPYSGHDLFRIWKYSGSVTFDGIEIGKPLVCGGEMPLYLVGKNKDNETQNITPIKIPAYDEASGSICSWSKNQGLAKYPIVAPDDCEAELRRRHAIEEHAP